MEKEGFGIRGTRKESGGRNRMTLHLAGGNEFGFEGMREAAWF